MPHSVHDVSQAMVTLLTKAVGAFVLLVLFFIFRYIFELEFMCSCRPGGIHTLGILYMVMPPCILYLMLYAINHKYQRPFCKIFRRCNSFCSFVAQQVFYLLSTGLFWIAAVLIDGDWYVCLKGNSDEIHLKIPCKTKENLTYDEHMLIVNWKNDSIIAGLALTCVGAGIWVIWSWCLIRFKCYESYYKRMYKDHLSQETETILKAALIELAQEQSKVIIQEPIRRIRETVRQPKGTSDENETTNDNTRADIEDEWNSLSDIFFYESERQTSYEVSLLSKYLQTEKEKAIQQSLQKVAEEVAEITNDRRFTEFISEWTVSAERVQRSSQTREIDRQSVM